MIKITGVCGDWSGFLTNIAIERLLEVQPDCICLLIDDSSEFVPLVDKLNGVHVVFRLHQTYEEYKQYVISKLSDNNFFVFRFYELEDWGREEDFENLEKLAAELKTMYRRKVHLIYKRSY